LSLGATTCSFIVKGVNWGERIDLAVQFEEGACTCPSDHQRMTIDQNSIKNCENLQTTLPKCHSGCSKCFGYDKSSENCYSGCLTPDLKKYIEPATNDYICNDLNTANYSVGENTLDCPYFTQNLLPQYTIQNSGLASYNLSQNLSYTCENSPDLTKFDAQYRYALFVTD
jgi:hypothetical protein